MDFLSFCKWTDAEIIFVILPLNQVTLIICHFAIRSSDPYHFTIILHWIKRCWLSYCCLATESNDTDYLTVIFATSICLLPCGKSSQQRILQLLPQTGKCSVAKRCLLLTHSITYNCVYMGTALKKEEKIMEEKRSGATVLHVACILDASACSHTCTSAHTYVCLYVQVSVCLSLSLWLTHTHTLLSISVCASLSPLIHIVNSTPRPTPPHP